MKYATSCQLVSWCQDLVSHISMYDVSFIKFKYNTFIVLTIQFSLNCHSWHYS